MSLCQELPAHSSIFQIAVQTCKNPFHLSIVTLYTAEFTAFMSMYRQNMTNFVVSRTIWFSITYIQKKIKGLTKQTISLTYILWYYPLTVKSKTVKQNSMFIATTSVINANSKTITMMKVFGYSSRECANAVLILYEAIINQMIISDAAQ